MKFIINNLHWFIILMLSLMLSGCGTTETQKDSRFKTILGREVMTKRPLRLYRIDPGLTGDNTHHCLTAGYYPFSETDSGEIGVIPANYAVRFDKVRRTRSISAGEEYLIGIVKFKGVTYPISYTLGLIGDDSNAGWRRIYLSFEVPKTD